jgi:hypothetical protein
MTFIDMKIRVGVEPERYLDALYERGYTWQGKQKPPFNIRQNTFLFARKNGYITYDSRENYFKEHAIEEAVLIGSHFIYKKSLVVNEVPRFIGTSTSPPVGLTPRIIVNNKRIQDIITAMCRYSAAGKAIPQQWIDELSELNSMAPDYATTN